MLTPISNRMMIEIHRQQGLSGALADTQRQIATGKRLVRGSDDPAASARIAALQRAEANGGVWRANLDRGLAANEAAATAAQALTDSLGNVRELLLAGANGGASVADRELLARQLEGVATAIDRLAAQKDATGQPLFRTDAPIMVRVGDDVALAPVPTRDAVFSLSGTPIATLVRDAAAALRSGTSTQIDLSLNTLDGAMASATDALAQIGQIGRQMEDLAETTASRQIELSAERSGLEDVDLSEAIARLNAQTLTLEAAQAAFARISRRTLFDIIG